MSDLIYGIDLGTTYTECAVIDPRTCTPRAFKLEGDLEPMASVVGLRLWNGRVVAHVGSSVFDELASSDEEIRVIEEAKRWMGTLECATGSDPPPWSFGGWSYVPQDVGAIILRQVKARVDEVMPEHPMVRAVITHPQNFTETQREATRQAARIAGLEVVTTLSEPDAAAICYGVSRQPGLYMVFDCGGGTLDITVARVVGEDRPIEVVTSDGLYQGGRDIDRCLLDAMYEQYEKSFPGFDRGQHVDRSTEVAWLSKARELKERLCRGNPVAGGEIRVGNPLYEGGICKMRITQGELDRLVSGLIEQFRQCTRRTLESAGLNCSDLQAVLLVGGTTRMPAVRQMLKELGAQVNTELDPSTAIAVGAAKYGRMLIDAGVASPSGASLAGTPGRARAELTFEEPLRSVLAHGLGIPVSRGGVDVLHVMVPKDTPLPHETEQTFHTSRAGATSITVTLHEGNREDFADSALLGNCVLTGIPRGRPAGQPVKVRLSIAHNGQKTLEVVDEKTGQRTRMAIEFNEKAVIRADDIDARRHHVMSIALAGQGL